MMCWAEFLMVVGSHTNWYVFGNIFWNNQTFSWGLSVLIIYSRQIWLSIIDVFLHDIRTMIVI